MKQFGLHEVGPGGDRRRNKTMAKFEQSYRTRTFAFNSSFQGHNRFRFTFSLGGHLEPFKGTFVNANTV